MVHRGHPLIFGLLTVQVVLAALGGVLGTRQLLAGGGESKEMPAVAQDVPRPVTLESAYPFALERAKQWDGNARLVLVSAQIDWPLDVSPGPVQNVAGGGWLTYVFVRERGDGDAASLGLLIERFSGRIVQERTVDWGEPAPEERLDFSAIPVSSVDAILAAERARGTEFRRSCPDARHQTRLSLGLSGALVESASPTEGGLATPAGSPSASGASASDEFAAGLSWLLGYRDVRDEGRPPLMISIDANSGAVAIEDRPSPATEGCPV